MKTTLTWDSATWCDLCEKHKDCIQLYRNAKRGEQQNFLVLICRDCALKILQAFPLQLNETDAEREAWLRTHNSNTGKPL